MSQAEELLATLTDDISVHTHSVTDSDTYFVIDPITHEIENTARKKRVLMQYDHRSERFTFELPRYVEGHDMTLCDRVRVHYNNVGTKTGAEEEAVEERADVVELTDLRINPDNTETVICSWLIERQSTQLVGILSFLVQYLCTDNGEVVYEWHSDIFEDIEIHKGRNNGEAAVIEYSNILEQWYTRIFGAGDSVMASIASESATQLSAIQAESEKQQTAIESKGAATLATIPEDYVEVYNMASEAVRTKADGIVCETEGESLIVRDSSDDYLKGLRLFGKTTQFTTTGKNLFDMDTWLTNSGIAWSKSGTKYTINTKTPIYNTPFVFSETDIEVTLSCKLTNKTTVNARFELLDSSNNIVGYFYEDHASHSCTASKIRINWTTTGDVEIDSPQIELGNSVTDYEPYTGGVPSPNPAYPQEIVSVENPYIEVYTKNLITKYTVKSTSDNMSIEPLDDGSIRFNGTADSRVIVYFIQSEERKDLAPGTYTISTGSVLPTGVTCIFERYSESAWEGVITKITNGASHSTVTLNEVTNVAFYLSINEGTTVDNLIIRPQLEIGDNPTLFEKPNTPQRLALPHTLPGIPVTSGGNYTDSDGQQWICDEVDFERGVYVQRVHTRTFDGTENWAVSDYQYEGAAIRYDYRDTGSPAQLLSNCYSSHFIYTGVSRIGMWVNSDQIKYAEFRIRWEYDSVEELKAFLAEQHAVGTPVTCMYTLRTPIETPLTAEELETFKVLHTNYPNTTILNDQSAYMKVSYNADTKTYVDNKIAEAVAQYLATA